MNERPKRRELHVAHVEKSRFRIDVRGHEIIVDQPADPRGDGTDTGPTPTELLIASVAGCAAYYGRTYLARRGLPDRVDILARWEYGSKPDRVTRIHLFVDAPGVPSERFDAFRRVLESCLVHNTLTQIPEIPIHLEKLERTEQKTAG